MVQELSAPTAMGRILQPRVFKKVFIRQRESGSWVWIRALEQTIDLYGWGETYPVGGDFFNPSNNDGKQRLFRAQSRRQGGGIPMMIGRHASIHRKQPHTYNSFRASSQITLSDLAELAHFTKIDWAWMKRPCGQYWSREEWACAYEAVR